MLLGGSNLGIVRHSPSISKLDGGSATAGTSSLRAFNLKFPGRSSSECALLQDVPCRCSPLLAWCAILFILFIYCSYCTP